MVGAAQGSRVAAAYDDLRGFPSDVQDGLGYAFLQEPPTFEEVVGQLRTLQQKINATYLRRI